MNKIINATLASAFWEPVDFGGLKQIYGLLVQNRNAADVQVSYVAGQATYWTVKSGALKGVSWSQYVAPVLYIKGTAGHVIEIEVTTTP